MHIHCTFIIDVKSKQKLDVVANAIKSNLNTEFTNEVKETYWKDTKKYKFTCECILVCEQAVDNIKCLFEAINKISPNWLLNISNANNDYIDGVSSDTFRINGITWAHFTCNVGN